MKTIKAIGAQGDVLFQRVKKLPKGVKASPEKAEYVVAHSETGHHHVARGRNLRHYTTEDPFVDFLEVRGPTQVRHERDFDTHETLKLLDKIDDVLYYRVLRQRQFTPEGWQRVID